MSASRFDLISFVDFTSNPLIPIAIALHSVADFIKSSMLTFIPIFTTLKPLFERIISTRFFPTSCTSPFTVPSTKVVSLSFSIFGRYGWSASTQAFIVSADWSTNGSCICPFPKSSPMIFIPSISHSLTITSAPTSSLTSKDKAIIFSFAPSKRSFFIFSSFESFANSSSVCSATASISLKCSIKAKSGSPLTLRLKSKSSQALISSSLIL